jgi:hypothetical protein
VTTAAFHDKGAVAAVGDHGHPAANWLRKQAKSSTFTVGAMVEPSQLA